MAPPRAVVVVVVYYNTMHAVPEAEPASSPPPTATRSPDFHRLAIFFSAVYFVQGFAEPKAGIAAQPIFFLLKDGMRLTAGQTATFLALVGIAWTGQAAVRDAVRPRSPGRLPAPLLPAGHDRPGRPGLARPRALASLSLWPHP